MTIARWLVYGCVLPLLVIASGIGLVFRILLLPLPTCCIGTWLVDLAVWLLQAPLLAFKWIVDKNCTE